MKWVVGGGNKCSVRGGRGDLICSSPRACVGRFGAWLDADCPAQIECFSVLASPLQCLEISAMTCDDLSLMSLTQLMDFKWLRACSRWWWWLWITFISQTVFMSLHLYRLLLSWGPERVFFFLFYFLSSNTGYSFSCVPEALTMNIFQRRKQTQGDYCSIFFDFFRLNRPIYLVFHLLICVALNHIYSPKGLQHAHIKKKQWRQ